MIPNILIFYHIMQNNILRLDCILTEFQIFTFSESIWGVSDSSNNSHKRSNNEKRKHRYYSVRIL